MGDLWINLDVANIIDFETLPFVLRNLFDEDPNTRDVNLESVLHKYVYYNTHYDGILQALIDRVTDLEIENGLSRTAFLLAVIQCRTLMIETFIKNGANVHTYDYLRQNALFYIASPERDHMERTIDVEGAEMRYISTFPFLNSLLEKGVDVNLQNYQGFTPLMCAAGGNYLKIVQMLLKYGAKVYLENVHLRNCLHLASNPEEKNKPVWDTANCSIMSELILNGACVNCFDNEYKTPFGYILRSTHRNKDYFTKAFLTAASLLHWERRIEFYINPGRILGGLPFDDSWMLHVTDCYKEIDRLRRFQLSEESNLCQFALRGVSESGQRIASVECDRVLVILSRETFPLYESFIERRFKLEYLQRKLMEFKLSTRSMGRQKVSLNPYVNFTIASFLDSRDIYNVIRASFSEPRSNKRKWDDTCF